MHADHMMCTNSLLSYCSSVHREGLETIQQVVKMAACQDDVEGYLQLTDHIIQQIKCTEAGPDQPHLKEVGTLILKEFTQRQQFFRA